MLGLEGTTLGRYRLKQKLGQGGMSEVYLAYDEDLDRDVAIKVVSSSHAEYIERFKREAKAIGRLAHEHILPAFDSGEQGVWHYLVMPYIEHDTLRERLERSDLTLEETAELLYQIASALQCAHDNGIVHRDIKPSNILLRDDHYAYLADFGLAKSIKGSHDLTQLGTLLGTPEYMAPELAEGPATTSSDIYALGVLLYQMVTGRVPFEGPTPMAVYMKQLREAPLPPSYINPAIPPAVEQVILRALEKDPAYRYATAMELAQAYMEALQASPAGAELPPLYEINDIEEYMPPAYPEPPSILAETPPFLPGQKARMPQSSNSGAAPSALPPVKRNSTGNRRFSNRDERRELKIRSNPPVTTTRGNSNPGQLTEPVSTPERSPATPGNPIQRPPVAHRRQRRSPKNGFLITGLMGFCLLLIIIAMVIFAIVNREPTLQSSAVVGSTPGATTTAPASASPATTGVSGQAQGTGTTPNPQATQQAAVATATTITSAAPLLKDNLSSDSSGNWPNDGTNCVFRQSSYHVIVTAANYLQPCELNDQTFGNVAISVDATLLSGSDAGLIFRANGDQFYDFEINSKGEFFFRRHDAGAGAQYVYLLKNTLSNTIAPGGLKNALLVIASGSNFKLFINGTFVGEAQDATYTSGQMGFVAGTLRPDNSGEASFANLNVYRAGP